jgi:hypothetical protein
LVEVKVALVTEVLVVVGMLVLKVAVVANFLKVIMEAVLESTLQVVAAVLAVAAVLVEPIPVQQEVQEAQEQHLQLQVHL